MRDIVGRWRGEVEGIRTERSPLDDAVAVAADVGATCCCYFDSSYHYWSWRSRETDSMAIAVALAADSSNGTQLDLVLPRRRYLSKIVT